MKFLLLESENIIDDFTSETKADGNKGEIRTLNVIEKEIVNVVLSVPNKGNTDKCNSENHSKSNAESSVTTENNNLASKLSDLKFKTFFESVPNSSNNFSDLAYNCDIEMELETNVKECAGENTISVDELLTKPSTSANLDDSVVILETKNVPHKRINKRPFKYGNGSIIDVDEVLIISDGEDELPFIIENNCQANVNGLATKNMDVICVSSPYIHESPAKQFLNPRKRRKKEATYCIDGNLPIIPSQIQSQSELNVVLEKKNCSSLKRPSRTVRYNPVCSKGFRQKGLRKRGNSVNSSLPKKKRKPRNKQRRKIINRNSSKRTSSLFPGPDLFITFDGIVNEGSRCPQSKPSSSSAQTSCVNVQNKENATCVMNNSSFSRKRALRPIVIDGSNVAYTHGQRMRPKKFSCKGIELCVKYFQDRGHEVTVFVPQHRRCKSKEVVDQNILEKLGQQQVVVFTPSRIVDGVLISSYDDRFILDLASRTGAVIVSNDNYRDLINEKPEWKQAVNERLLMYLFAGDHFMVPDDPLGRRGVSLDKFLSFPVDIN